MDDQTQMPEGAKGRALPGDPATQPIAATTASDDAHPNLEPNGSGVEPKGDPEAGGAVSGAWVPAARRPVDDVWLPDDELASPTAGMAGEADQGDGARATAEGDAGAGSAASGGPDGSQEQIAAGASARSRFQRGAAFGAALVVGMAVGGGGTAAALSRTSSSTASAGTATQPVTTPIEAPAWPGLSAAPSTQQGSGSSSTDGATGMSGAPGADGRTGTSSGTSSSGTTTATAAAATGVVTVAALVSEQGQQGVSAGTGMVLTSDGIVLTNNHVVEGASAVQVTDPTTGQTYAATVVATDARADVAVLQIADASDLATVTLDDETGAAVGDDVTSVGNAEGEGALIAADGEVVALDQTVTTETETVDGLFAFSSAVVEGDSGGPVYDDEGEVVGMTTAMATDGVRTIAYAISIQDAVAVAVQLDPDLATSDAV